MPEPRNLNFSDSKKDFLTPFLSLELPLCALDTLTLRQALSGERGGSLETGVIPEFCS